MQNIKLSGVVVAVALCVAANARADGEPEAQSAEVFVATSTSAPSVPVADDDVMQSHGKPGLVATGIVLTVLGGAHIALGAAAFASASSCSGGWCFRAMDNLIGGVAVGIGATLALVGIPLTIYGATANTSRPHAQLGFSPTGVTLGGTF